MEDTRASPPTTSALKKGLYFCFVICFLLLICSIDRCRMKVYLLTKEKRLSLIDGMFSIASIAAFNEDCCTSNWIIDD